MRLLQALYVTTFKFNAISCPYTIFSPIAFELIEFYPYRLSLLPECIYVSCVAKFILEINCVFDSFLYFYLHHGHCFIIMVLLRIFYDVNFSWFFFTMPSRNWLISFLKLQLNIAISMFNLIIDEWIIIKIVFFF